MYDEFFGLKMLFSDTVESPYFKISMTRAPRGIRNPLVALVRSRDQRPAV